MVTPSLLVNDTTYIPAANLLSKTICNSLSIALVYTTSPVIEYNRSSVYFSCEAAKSIVTLPLDGFG